MKFRHMKENEVLPSLIILSGRSAPTHLSAEKWYIYLDHASGRHTHPSPT